MQNVHASVILHVRKLNAEKPCGCEEYVSVLLQTMLAFCFYIFFLILRRNRGRFLSLEAFHDLALYTTTMQTFKHSSNLLYDKLSPLGNVRAYMFVSLFNSWRAQGGCRFGWRCQTSKRRNSSCIPLRCCIRSSSWKTVSDFILKWYEGNRSTHRTVKATAGMIYLRWGQAYGFHNRIWFP